ncbi:MAG: hypothetical protein ABIL01_00520 [Pseudomonadota bacterium]
MPKTISTNEAEPPTPYLAQIKEIAEFREKMQNTPADMRNGIALEEIAIQLIRINARLDEVGAAIDNASLAMS